MLPLHFQNHAKQVSLATTIRASYRISTSRHASWATAGKTPLHRNKPSPRSTTHQVTINWALHWDTTSQHFTSRPTTNHSVQIKKKVSHRCYTCVRDVLSACKRGKCNRCKSCISGLCDAANAIYIRNEYRGVYASSRLYLHASQLKHEAKKHRLSPWRIVKRRLHVFRRDCTPDGFRYIYIYLLPHPSWLSCLLTMLRLISAHVM